jgi:Phytanoyl-CoA dioxygenase (PhyH)
MTTTAAQSQDVQAAAEHKLSSRQVAEFVSRGILRFDAIVPEDLNRASMDEMRTMRERFLADPVKAMRDRIPAGRPLDDCFTDSPGLGRMLRLPQIAGMIESLVGPNPSHDHNVVHVREPGGPGQPLHADEIIDTRLRFDIQLMYWPHDVALEDGGTFFVPGSHFRRINDQDIARYKNFRGQECFSGPAGTVLLLHHGLWHCARPNRGRAPRYMFKIRLNPRVEQVRLWDVSDLGDPDVRQSINALLAGREPWFEQPTGLLDQVNRVVLWRYMTGDDGFDVHYRVERLHNRGDERLLSALP